jgi:hypothetical protein
MNASRKLVLSDPAQAAADPGRCRSTIYYYTVDLLPRFESWQKLGFLVQVLVNSFKHLVTYLNVS